MCALKSLKSIACTSPRTNDIIAALSSSSASLSCSSRGTSNLTGFFGIFRSRDSFSSFTAKTGPAASSDVDADVADARSAPDREARSEESPVADARTPPLAVSAPFPFARVLFNGDVDGDGFAEDGAEDGATAPPLSTCAAAAVLSVAGALILWHIASAVLDPTRRVTSSITFPPAARACDLISAKPAAAAATACARSTSPATPSSPAGPTSAPCTHASASALPSPLIFAVSSTILSAT